MSAEPLRIAQERPGVWGCRVICPSGQACGEPVTYTVIIDLDANRCFVGLCDRHAFLVVPGGPAEVVQPGRVSTAPRSS